MILALTALLVIAAACLPSIIWLAFFLKIDIHPEPKKLLAYTFGAGIFISVIILATQYLSKNIMLGGSYLLISFILLALIEEVFKFAAAYWSVNKNPAFNEPVDAMVYMITAALGFATVENLLVLASVAYGSGPASSPESFTEILILRFFGATLLHALTSGIVGFYWAKGKLRGTLLPKLLTGIAIATIVHVMFNYLIMHFQQSNLLLYPSLFLATAAFFVIVDFEKLEETHVNFLK